MRVIIRLLKLFFILILSLIMSLITTPIAVVLFSSCFLYRTGQYVFQGNVKGGPLPKWMNKVANFLGVLVDIPGKVVPMGEVK